jgi:hypothetical protein
VGGKSGESRLVKYLLGTLQPRMPVGGALKPAEIDRIRRWIDAGAKADAGPPVEKAPASPEDAMPTLAVAAPATALAFSPDGKTLAVGAYREVQFWERGGGVESRESRVDSKGQGTPHWLVDAASQHSSLARTVSSFERVGKGPGVRGMFFSCCKAGVFPV